MDSLIVQIVRLRMACRGYALSFVIGNSDVELICQSSFTYCRLPTALCRLPQSTLLQRESKETRIKHPRSAAASLEVRPVADHPFLLQLVRSSNEATNDEGWRCAVRAQAAK